MPGFILAQEEIPVTGIYLDTAELTLKIFTTEELNASVVPNSASNKKITWHSGDKNIVKIIKETGSSVVIEALAPGTTNIYAATQEGRFQKYCRVQVVVPISKIFLEPAEAVLFPEEEVQFTLRLEPEHATSSAVIWQSSDNGVVSVDQNGVAKAYKNGEARIIARSEDNEQIFAYSQVVVTDKEALLNAEEQDAAPKEEDEALSAEEEASSLDSVTSEVQSSAKENIYLYIGLILAALIIIILVILLIRQRR